MATITLENIPVDIHEALRARAESQGTTIENEALSCLKFVLRPLGHGDKPPTRHRPIRINNDALWADRHSPDTP